MNSYEMKQEARRQRLEDRAEKATREAQSRFQRAHAAIEGIPMGQPILVGHHSEKRHRADLARHDSNMRKGIEAQEKAGHYAAAADSVGSAGISSDDPEAIEKLKERLVELETAHAIMKMHNAEAKKLKLPGRPHAAYEFSNSGANIRRIKDRIAHLQKRQVTPPAEPVEYPGGIWVTEDREINRVQIKFPGIPAPGVRQALKRSGFRWSPSEGAWQRHAGNSALWWARDLADKISKGEVK